MLPSTRSTAALALRGKSPTYTYNQPLATGELIRPFSSQTNIRTPTSPSRSYSVYIFHSNKITSNRTHTIARCPRPTTQRYRQATTRSAIAKSRKEGRGYAIRFVRIKPSIPQHSPEPLKFLLQERRERGRNPKILLTRLVTQNNSRPNSKLGPPRLPMAPHLRPRLLRNRNDAPLHPTLRPRPAGNNLPRLSAAIRRHDRSGDINQ